MKGSSGAGGLATPLLSPAGLIASQVLVSAGALILEIVAGRMLAPYVGMSVYTWTAVIAVVLAGLSVGHWVGGRIAEKPVPAALSRTAILIALGGLTAAASIFMLRWFAPSISRAADSVVLEISLLATVAFFLPSFFAGVPSPVIANLSILIRPDKQGRAIGAVFAAGAIGAIIGTLMSGYLLIAWLGSTATVVLVAAVYCLVALQFAVSAGTRGALVTCGALVIATALVSVVAVRALTPCTEESRYFCIRVVDVSGDVGRTARLMVLDHLGHGISVEDDPDELVMPYVSIIDTVIRTRLQRHPQSAFFVGGGAFTLPRAWAAGGTRSITVAEVDPAVTQLAKERFWLDEAGMVISHSDARSTLRDTSGRFEVIVGDAFTDIAVPAHLVTREFFALVRSRLDERGIYAMNFVDNADTALAVTAVKTTLEAIFAHIDVFAEIDDLRSGGRTTFVLFASDVPIGVNSLRERGRQNRQFVNITASPKLSGDAPGTAIILTDDYAPIDRLIGTTAM